MRTMENANSHPKAEQVIALRKQGYSYDQIHATTGVWPSDAVKILKPLGLAGSIQHPMLAKQVASMAQAQLPTPATAIKPTIKRRRKSKFDTDIIESNNAKTEKTVAIPLSLLVKLFRSDQISINAFKILTEKI